MLVDLESLCKRIGLQAEDLLLSDQLVKARNIDLNHVDQFETGLRI
jgi:hypothetical protein